MSEVGVIGRQADDECGSGGGIIIVISCARRHQTAHTAGRLFLCRVSDS